jgi:HEAT repeat protein
MPLIRDTRGAGAAPPDLTPEAARSALLSADAEMRWRAARALGVLPDAARVLGQAALAEHDPRVREAMFTSLSRMATAESVAALLPHMRADDAERRTAAMDALRAMPRAVLPVLPGLLADPDPDVRLLACDLARELPGADATSLLAAVLDGEAEANVCAAAIDVLAEIGTPDALPALHRYAGRTTDPFLTFAIKIACDRIGEQVPPR